MLLTMLAFCGNLNNAMAQSCLPDGITFTSQSEIDNFPLNYPGCNELNGYITISGFDITNLEGLKNVISIEGDLNVKSNMCLTDLKGLENLKSVNGDLSIRRNSSMTSFSGLNNVTSIGGSLLIVTNYKLRDVTDLYNLQSIGNRIWIWNNPYLTSLEGLDNADLGGITDLRIMYNERLSTCEIPSICDYLSGDTDTTILISDNAAACNSVEEIQNACVQLESIVTFFGTANPYGQQIVFKYTLAEDSPVKLQIFDRMGREMATLVDQYQTKGTYIIEFNNGSLAAGIYLCVLNTSQGKQTIKLLKVTGQ